MNELDSFTVSELEYLASSEIENDVTRRLARIALAAKTAEPVTWWTGPEQAGEMESFHDHETGSHQIPLAPALYATPVLNSPELPDGWKLAPVEPTRKMMSQGHFAMGGTDRGKFRRIYQAMINASPTTEK